ncbi:MAG: NfeD family protein [Pseudomonadota bacterium]|nr:NfeD family protein [Pseudomonadota bacterium]
MAFLDTHLAEALMIISVIALIVEVAVLGMSTYVLLFLGLSLFASGLLMNIGLLDTTYTTALWSNIVFTLGFALVLWKPLKRMQDKTDTKPIHSDFAELTFVVNADVDDKGLTTHQYSGITWQLKSQSPIAAGSTVKVTDKQVGVLWVEAV